MVDSSAKTVNWLAITRILLVGLVAADGPCLAATTAPNSATSAPASSPQPVTVSSASTGGGSSGTSIAAPVIKPAPGSPSAVTYVAPVPAEAQPAANSPDASHTSDAIDRLVFTIIGGTVVAFVGIISKREVDIDELHKLSGVLSDQLVAMLAQRSGRADNIRSSPDRVNLYVVVPVSVDDFKPLARYMRSRDIVVYLKAAAMVCRHGEVAQEVSTVPAASERDKYERLNDEMTRLHG